MIDVLVEDFAAWRNQARTLLGDSRNPGEVHFCDKQHGQPALTLDHLEGEETPPAETARVPAEFLHLAETVGYHRNPNRWNLLYRLLWRLTRGEPHLLEDHSEASVRELRLMEKAVRRDIHKMRAFVRFRKVTGPSDPAIETYVAWHRPEHLIVRANAPFFVRRFGALRWAILTPDESVWWDLRHLRFGPGLPRDAAPPDDQIEDLWLTYYSSIFNPARLNLAAMASEMPARHWSTMPETKIMGDLIRNAHTRVDSMVKKQPTSARPFVPDAASLKQLATAARSCEGCELFRNATQIFGEGPAAARFLFVGEQPGDQEDLAGKPFVGPAGKLFDQALAEAGIERSEVYITNAVKHFYFEERGKRRIHKTPRGTHISACRPWLEAEIENVKPEVIVCLGSTAAQSLLGRDVRVLRDRGQWLENRWAARLLVTIHPSAILRMTDPQSHREEYARFVGDLKLVAEYKR